MSQDPCDQFLQKLVIAFQTKQIPQDPQIAASFAYSGVGWNDQGDVDACVRDPLMSFQELQLGDYSGGRLFRGFCLPSFCSQNYLNAHKAFFMKMIPQITDPDQINFYEYPESAKVPLSSSDFIGMTIFLAFFFLLIAASYFLSRKPLPKRPIKQATVISDTSSFRDNSVVITKGTLEKPLLPTQSKTKSDLEQLSSSTIQQKLGGDEKKKRKPLYISIIDCWNLPNNIKKICTLNSSNPELQAFNCIRVFSFFQVVLGHEFFLRMGYMVNMKDLPIITSKPFGLFIFACLYAVDVFFFFGGFFVAYASTNPKYLNLFQFKKGIKVVITYFMAIINRICRILPAYLIALLIFWKYEVFFGDSPTWYSYVTYTYICDDDWWKKILFIDNLWLEGSDCFGWGWYLANDMQMFIFSLLLIIIYANNRFAGKISIIVCFCVFQFVSLYVTYDKNYLITTSVATMPPNPYYIKPWTRSPPYFLGLLFGIFYKEYVAEKLSEKKVGIMSKIKHFHDKIPLLKWGMYALGLFLVFYFIFGPRPLQVHGQNYWSDGVQNFWFGSCRSFYVMGIYLILLPGMCGSQDLLYKFMSSKAFQFLAKLTFSGYLIHYLFLLYSKWGFDDSIYITYENILQLYATELFLTLIFSFFFVAIIEQPFSNLANIFLNSGGSGQANRTASATTTTSLVSATPSKIFIQSKSQIFDEKMFQHQQFQQTQQQQKTEQAQPQQDSPDLKVKING